MKKNIPCLVGRDSDDAHVGVAFAIAIAIIVIMVVVAIVIYGGAIIGGFHSLKNYFISFKHNVYDSNRAPVPAA